jgi:hypothetical protein
MMRSQLFAGVFHHRLGAPSRQYSTYMNVRDIPRYPAVSSCLGAVITPIRSFLGVLIGSSRKGFQSLYGPTR